MVQIRLQPDRLHRIRIAEHVIPERNISMMRHVQAQECAVVRGVLHIRIHLHAVTQQVVRVGVARIIIVVQVRVEADVTEVLGLWCVAAVFHQRVALPIPARVDSVGQG